VALVWKHSSTIFAFLSAPVRWISASVTYIRAFAGLHAWAPVTLRALTSCSGEIAIRELGRSHARERLEFPLFQCAGEPSFYVAWEGNEFQTVPMGREQFSKAMVSF
jgi:hypothetical protein